MDESTRTFLLRVLEENWLHAKLSEEKRATLANLVLILTVVTQVVIVFTGFSKRVLPLTCLLIALGLYAMAVSMKLYERAQFHTRRARKLRAYLDQHYPETQVEVLQAAAEEEHRKDYPFWMHVRLHTLWLGLHLLVAIVGIIETVLCLW